MSWLGCWLHGYIHIPNSLNCTVKYVGYIVYNYTTINLIFKNVFLTEYLEYIEKPREIMPTLHHTIQIKHYHPSLSFVKRPYPLETKIHCTTFLEGNIEILVKLPNFGIPFSGNSKPSDLSPFNLPLLWVFSKLLNGNI